jgi:hypothetical protein
MRTFVAPCRPHEHLDLPAVGETFMNLKDTSMDKIDSESRIQVTTSLRSVRINIIPKGINN